MANNVEPVTRRSVNRARTEIDAMPATGEDRYASM